MRAMIPADPVPSTIAGRTMCRTPPMPAAGSQPSSTANSMTSMIASQKAGIETPISASDVER